MTPRTENCGPQDRSYRPSVIPPTRRHVIAAAVGASAASSATAQTRPATDDLDAAARLLGRSYTPGEAELMRRGLARTAALLPALRRREIPPDVDPAVTFDPTPFDPPTAGPMTAELADGNPDADPAWASLADLAAMLRAGKTTSVELTRLSLDRLKKHGDALKCVVTLTEDLAMRQAERADAELKNGTDRGPLHGIPYGAKDLLAVKNYPTTYGVAPFADQILDRDATVITRLEEAGAVLVAKLSLGELAMGDVWFGGTTRNPWNPDEGSSGSSAGSCSAVAAGLVPFALGSETLGSIVSPCVACGTCGLRPTYGRVPRTGAMPLARTMDKLGPIARRADDLAYVLAAIAGPDGEDPTARAAPFSFPHDGPIRVGFDAAAFEAAARMPAYADGLDRCRELFGDLAEVRLPADPLLFPTALATVEVEAAESFAELVDANRLNELVQQGEGDWPNIFRRASLFPAVDYLRAQRLRRRYMREMAEAMNGVDVFVTVPRLGPNLALTNLTGHPCCLVRLAVVDDLPLQIEFVGRPYGEDKLLTVASRFEATVTAREEWPRGRWG